MDQPPQPAAQPPADDDPGRGAAVRLPLPRGLDSHRRPAWRLPAGVAPGTWQYTQSTTIAGGYREFIAQTPLVALDHRVLLEHLPGPRSERSTRVVDFGCGDGRTLRALWDTGYDVLGVDLSQPMLRHVIAGDHGHALQHRLIRANLVQLGCLAAGAADHGACLFSTIGMIRGRAHRIEFLRHAARIIRPGGTFVLHVHNRNAAWRDRPSSTAWLRSAWKAMRDRKHEHGDRTYAYRGLADMFLHTYSMRELKADLRTSGWHIQRILPLSVTGGELLSHPQLLPALRAGGFVAVATAPPERSPTAVTRSS